jgi:hypothetical protein
MLTTRIYRCDASEWGYDGHSPPVLLGMLGQAANSTGKERDSESGLDDFGARYNSSSIGRYMSPDWSAAPTPVPYANVSDPQSLNPQPVRLRPEQPFEFYRPNWPLHCERRESLGMVLVAHSGLIRDQERNGSKRGEDCPELCRVSSLAPATNQRDGHRPGGPNVCARRRIRRGDGRFWSFGGWGRK